MHNSKFAVTGLNENIISQEVSRHDVSIPVCKRMGTCDFEIVLLLKCNRLGAVYKFLPWVKVCYSHKLELDQPPVAKPGYSVMPPSTNKVSPVT